jgi:hypothetical protein
MKPTWKSKWIWAVTLTLSVHAILPAAAASGTNSPTPLESFKMFIAAPPRLEALVWKKTLSGNTTGRTLDKDDSASTSHVAWFLARWQPGCLFLKSGFDSTVSVPLRRPGEQVNARLGDDFWTVEALGMTTHWRDSAPASPDITMQPARAFHHRAEEFNQVMNMGLMHLEAGTVRWSGNNLSATGYIQEIKSRVRVTGTVDSDSRGRAGRMTIRYFTESNARTYNYVTRYKYATNAGLAFLPSSIGSFFVNGGGTNEIQQMQYYLVSIKPAATALPDSFFDPRSASSSPGPVVLYQNDGWYMTNHLGKLAPIPTPSGPGGMAAAISQWHRNQLYYGAVLVSIVLAFSLIRRINKATQAKTKTKEERMMI